VHRTLFKLVTAIAIDVGFGLAGCPLEPAFTARVTKRNCLHVGMGVDLPVYPKLDDHRLIWAALQSVSSNVQGMVNEIVDMIVRTA